MKFFRKIYKTAFLALGIVALLCLGACGGSAAKDVPVSTIVSDVNTALGKADSLAELDSNFLGLTKLSAGDLGEHAVLINVYGTNIDEYGVFRAGTKSASELKSVVEDYLSKRVASWMEEYMPEEKPKLTNAEVRTAGDYVMYCILSDSDKETAFKAFENALK